VHFFLIIVILNYLDSSTALTFLLQSSVACFSISMLRRCIQ